MQQQHLPPTPTNVAYCIALCVHLSECVQEKHFDGKGGDDGVMPYLISDDDHKRNWMDLQSALMMDTNNEFVRFVLRSFMDKYVSGQRDKRKSMEVEKEKEKKTTTTTTKKKVEEGGGRKKGGGEGAKKDVEKGGRKKEDGVVGEGKKIAAVRRGGRGKSDGTEKADGEGSGTAVVAAAAAAAKKKEEGGGDAPAADEEFDPYAEYADFDGGGVKPEEEEEDEDEGEEEEEEEEEEEGGEGRTRRTRRTRTPILATVRKLLGPTTSSNNLVLSNYFKVVVLIAVLPLIPPITGFVLPRERFHRGPNHQRRNHKSRNSLLLY